MMKPGIILLAGLVALGGCVASRPFPAPGPAATVAAPKTTLIFLEDSHDFSVFVEPSALPRERALALATDKARLHCQRNMGGTSPKITAITHRPPGLIRSAWKVDGTCK